MGKPNWGFWIGNIQNKRSLKMDNTALIALITTLVVSITGNIAAWWQLANQRTKDKQDAQTVLIDSLRAEVSRLQTRGIELENNVINKATEIGELKLAAIDKEAELRTMKYNMQAMQARLNAVPEQPLMQPLEENESIEWDDNLLSIGDVVLPLDAELEIEEDQKKRVMVSESAAMEIQEMRDNSISKGKF
jgi:hypothetical protein